METDTPGDGAATSYGYLAGTAGSEERPAVPSALELRRAAALAWKALPSKHRREALQYGRRARLHPDPHVRRAVHEYAVHQRGALATTLAVIAVPGLVVLAWGVVLGVPLRWTLLPLGFTCLLLVNTAVVMRRLIRVAVDPTSPIATPNDRQRIDRVAGFRSGWFARIAMMVVGFSLGPVFAFAGVVVMIQGNGNRFVAGVVALVAFAALGGAVTAARAQIRDTKARRSG